MTRTLAKKMKKNANIIFLDGIAGVLSGSLVLLLSSLISETHNWSQTFILLHVIASLTYGAYSLVLSYRRFRPVKMISILAVANCIWALVCGALAILLSASLTTWGLGHLVLEFLFVGALGIYEWRFRHSLVRHPTG